MCRATGVRLKRRSRPLIIKLRHNRHRGTRDVCCSATNNNNV